jgi:hydroxymethylbilane synthase
MDRRTIRVATRKSALAMRQTEIAIAVLAAHCPDWSFEVIPMRTTGDDRLSWSLESSGGKGLFTSALEQAIVEGAADLAVHSAKDLPTEMPDGVVLAGYLPRAPAHDLLVIREKLTAPAVIATSSPRRRAQLRRIFPDAEWREIRGNVETRLRKVAEGEADATLMAMAGLYRLGILHFPGLRLVPLPLTRCVPAAGQGAIGLQVRAADKDLYAPHLCPETAWAVTLERAFLAALGGGCHSATAVHARNGLLHVYEESRGYQCHDLPAVGGWTDEAAMQAWIAERLT